MKADMEIRAERPGDVEFIRDVIDSAFAGMPFAAGDEADLVEALRREGALTVSLVAELEGAIVGQVVLSPAQASDGATGWYALGPVAVVPAHQGVGVGAALVDAGLRALVDLDAAGCILTGNPAYYRRFGFASARANCPPGEPAEFFMIKLLRGPQPRGPIRFHEAFGTHT